MSFRVTPNRRYVDRFPAEILDRLDQIWERLAYFNEDQTGLLGPTGEPVELGASLNDLATAETGDFVALGVESDGAGSSDGILRDSAGEALIELKMVVANRTGDLSDLIADAGVDGQISVAQDKGTLVLHNGVEGEAVALPYLETTPSGGTVLVGPDGPVPLREPQVSAHGFELLPTNDITQWITDKTAALTVEVDNTVLFDGRPTIKITIPAGTSGVVKVGTSTATARMPYLWDRENLAIATMYSGFTGYDYSSTYPPAPTVYFGNAAYADFWTVASFYGANYPEHKMRADEWCVRKIAASEWVVGGGNPVANLTDGSGHIDEAALRMKLQWTQVSQATDCYIWIGFVGKMPARKKPTLIWSIDDGYDEWFTFIRPLMQHYDQPVTMAIASGYVDTSGYLTTAQIQEMFADPQRLFDFVNHSTDNSHRGTLGDAAYYANVQACRAFLRGIGVTGDGPLHHILVQGQWSNALVDLLAAGGYLTARGPAEVAMHGRDQLIRTGRDKMRWQLNKYGGSLDSTISLATAKASVDGIISNNIVGLFNAHRFAAAAGTDQWAYADMEQLVGYVASKVDADELEVKSLSRWHADLTGRVCALK